jgi:hypothetical protein
MRRGYRREGRRTRKSLGFVWSEEVWVGMLRLRRGGGRCRGEERRLRLDGKNEEVTREGRG